MIQKSDRRRVDGGTADDRSRLPRIGSVGEPEYRLTRNLTISDLPAFTAPHADATSATAGYSVPTESTDQ